MLQENLKALWYYYGYGRDFRNAGAAISQLRSECENLGMNLQHYKIVINDECESVRLAPQ